MIFEYLVLTLHSITSVMFKFPIVSPWTALASISQVRFPGDMNCSHQTNLQLSHHSFRIWPVCQLGVVPFQSLHKALCHLYMEGLLLALSQAFILVALHIVCLCGSLAPAVISQPLSRMRWLAVWSKSFLQSRHL